MNKEKTWNYFSDDEVKGLDKEFVALLDRARHISGIPYLITSGLRTKEKNDSLKDSVKNSSHLFGLAVDLKVDDSSEAYAILKGLYSVGLNRIILYFKIENENPIWTHIHVDNDKTKPQNKTVLIIEK